MSAVTDHRCVYCGGSVAPDERVCRVCRNRPEPSSYSEWFLMARWKLLLVLGILVLAAVLALVPPLFRRAEVVRYERLAMENLRKIHQAEFEFRDRDRSSDGRSSFWTEDVAGLYAILDVKGYRGSKTRKIALIPVWLAQADQNPMPDEKLRSDYPEPIRSFGGQRACQEYWFRSLPPPTGMDAGFCVAAMPMGYGVKGREVLLIDNAGTIRLRDFGGAVLASGKTPPALSGLFSPGEFRADEPWRNVE